MSSYKGKQDGDKKINDVRKQYHSNKNYAYCGLMTDLILILLYFYLGVIIEV